MASSPPRRIHGSVVAIGETGVLIRGEPGSGKSHLALAVIAAARRQDGFARLVADDRVELATRGGRVTARPVAPLEGLVERRGLGLTPEPWLPSVRLGMVVDLGEAPARMPEPEDMVETLAGVALPRIRLTAGAGDAELVLAALRLFLAPP